MDLVRGEMFTEQHYKDQCQYIYTHEHTHLCARERENAKRLMEPVQRCNLFTMTY